MHTNETDKSSPFWVNPELMPIFRAKWKAECKQEGWNYYSLEQWFNGIATQYTMRPCRGAYDNLYYQALQKTT